MIINVDFIAISGSLDGRIIEFVDHLHEHFHDSVVIKNGHYMPPMMPGYSIEMKSESLKAYSFPNGKMWQDEITEPRLLVTSEK